MSDKFGETCGYPRRDHCSVNAEPSSYCFHSATTITIKIGDFDLPRPTSKWRSEQARRVTE